MMKIFNVLLSFVIVIGITSCASSGKKKSSAGENWTPIFDGKTTTGWRGYNKTTFPAAGWEVVDGTLHCKASGSGEAGAGGDIIYDKKLGNFELSLEWNGEKMEFTNITDSENVRICIEDAFTIADGHPTFNKKWTEPMSAKQFAAEMVKHNYRTGWSLPAMPV